MKRLLIGALALLLSIAAQATTLNPVQLLNPSGSSSGQAIVSNGASSAPSWASIVDSIIAGSGVTVSGATGNVTISVANNAIALSQLAQVGANTLLGNASGSTANVTAVSVTGCNGAAQALQWTSGSGFGCNSAIATSGANANITSLSGLSTALTVSQGGTGRVTLTAHGVLAGEGTGAINQIAVGTTGQMLLGVTGADPAFGNNATITSGTITGTPISGSTGAFTTLTGSSLAKVFATKATAQTLASSSQTTVTTWVTTYDANSNFNASTGTFTAPATGDYWISSTIVTVSGALGASSQFDCVLLVNGAQTAAGNSYYPAAGTSVASCTVTALQHLTASQTVNIAVFNGTGVSLTTTTNAASTSVSIGQVP